MRTVDTRGQLCPAPVIAAKKALRETGGKEPFIILTDNKTSFSNLIRFLSDNKAEVKSTEQDGVWTITVMQGGSNENMLRAEDYCQPEVAHFEKGNFIIVMSSDRMGEGDESLGRLLALNFIKAVKDLDTLPEKMIFYNSGVKLTVSGTESAEHLVQLSKMGVGILICSTCAGHYGIEGKTAAGIISNIFTIAQEMASAQKIIRP